MDPESIVVSNIMEEENKNSSQFDIDEKKVVLGNFKNFESIYYTEKGKNNLYYSKVYKSYTSTIDLPPPEYII